MLKWIQKYCEVNKIRYSKWYKAMGDVQQQLPIIFVVQWLQGNVLWDHILLVYCWIIADFVLTLQYLRSFTMQLYDVCNRSYLRKRVLTVIEYSAGEKCCIEWNTWNTTWALKSSWSKVECYIRLDAIISIVDY